MPFSRFPDPVDPVDPDENKKDPNEDRTVISGVTFLDKTVTYDGREHGIFIEEELPDGVTVSYTNNGKTDAGTYQVSAKLTSSSENIVLENDEFTATLIIKKKPIGDVVTFPSAEREYNGGIHSIYAEGIPDGVEATYSNNEQTEMGTYTVVASFTDSTGNYDCRETVSATLTVTRPERLKRVVFYDDQGSRIKEIDIMEGSLITSNLVPSMKYSTGYNCYWDYDFYTPVSMDLHIHFVKEPKEFTLYYYENAYFEDEYFLIKEVTVRYDELVTLYIHEFDEFSYAPKYAAYYKDELRNEYKPLLNKSAEQIIVGEGGTYVFTHETNVYLAPLRESRNIKFAYVLDEENSRASVTDFFAEEVTIPKAIYRDGKEYFIYEIADGATEAHAFLTTLTFTADSELRRIGDRAFKWSALSYIEIPSSVEYIGEESFASSELRSVSVPENRYGQSITYGPDAFAYCPYLTYVHIPSWNNRNISRLLGAMDLSSLTISIGTLHMDRDNYEGFVGGSVGEIRIEKGFVFSGFNGITSLEKLYLGDTVAFATEIPNVKSVYTDKSLEEWLSCSFGSPNLSPAYYSEYFYTSEGGAYILFPSEIRIRTLEGVSGASPLSGIKQITSVIFEDGSETVRASFCAELPNLTSVYIPASVTEIGAYAFFCCTSLKTVTFAPGSRLTTVGASAFYQTAIESVSLPDGLITICSLAFSATALSEITIPASVEVIGYSAFSLNHSLKTVTFESGSALRKIEDEVFFSPIEKVYFGMTEAQWLQVEFRRLSNNGIFLYNADPDCYFLDGNGSYYLIGEFKLPPVAD